MYLHFIVAAASLFLFISQANCRLVCHSAASSNSSLPSSAEKKSFDDLSPNTAACAKEYTWVYSSRLGGEFELKSTDVTFTWFAFKFGPRTFLDCNSTFENSYYLEWTSPVPLSIVYYQRHCLCCGNLCNDATMDNICNTPPKFTGSCYGDNRKAGHNQPNLPSDKYNVPVTDSMSCFKATTYNDKQAFYMWGGASLGRNSHCGASSHITQDGVLYKGCSCCGQFCNGSNMDSILANTTTC